MTHIAFSGNLVSPVELRYTQTGKAVGSVTVAVNRKRGEQEETDFHRVTLWESLAENAVHLEKGTRVVVIGRLTQREYEDKEGNKRQSWDVTADAFGPDVRFAVASVTRTPRGGAVDRPSQPVSQPNDAWATPTFPTDETPF